MKNMLKKTRLLGELQLVRTTKDLTWEELGNIEIDRNTNQTLFYTTTKKSEKKANY